MGGCAGVAAGGGVCGVGGGGAGEVGGVEGGASGGFGFADPEWRRTGGPSSSLMPRGIDDVA